MGIFTLSTLMVCFLGGFYCFYQLMRNNKVYSIRSKWLEKGDSRYNKYTYSKMMDPNRSNLYGLEWPKESNYKF